MIDKRETSARVRIEPVGVEIQVCADESIMAAAQRSGYEWPTRCRGMAICGVCVLEVQTGAENLSLMEDREADTIEDLSAKQPASSGRIRLACQVKVLGDAVVVKPGVKRKDELGSPPPIYFA